MVALDLETTGVDPESARIVTASLVSVGGGRPVESWSVLLNPGVEIPPEASAVHGVSTQVARAHGMSAPTGVRSLIIRLAARDPSTPVVVFNARYDLTVLDREVSRHGMAWRPPGLVVDPLVIDRHLDRFRSGSRKLEAMCQHYRAILGGAHASEHDALAAARLAWVLGRRGRVIRQARDPLEVEEVERLRVEWARVRDDLPALHGVQVRWAAEQAASLERHLAREGRAERCSRAWPLVPAPEQLPLA